MKWIVAWVSLGVVGAGLMAANVASAQPMMMIGPGSQIGASVRDVAPDEQTRGVRVEAVRPGTPAETAGVQANDVVVQFDGEAVRSTRQFVRLVQETPPGRTVSMDVLRDGKRMSMTITPRAGGFVSEDFRQEMNRFRDRLPEFGGLMMMGGSGRLGVTVQGMTAQLAEYFGADDGLLVTSVQDDSPSARAGLVAGDVITSVAGTPVGSRGQLVRALRNQKGEVDIEIVRDKATRTVRVTIE